MSETSETRGPAAAREATDPARRGARRGARRVTTRKGFRATFRGTFGAGFGAAGLVALAALGGSGLGAGGCAKQQATTPKPPPPRLTPSPARPEADLDTRVRELQKQSADLATATHSLPGANPADNREKLRQVFNLLTQILPRLELVPTGGVYDHQVTVVDLTRTTLATSSPDLAIGPIVDRGLRATYNALDDAQRSRYYDQNTQLRSTLDQLSGRLPDLDRTQGPEHDLVWAEAFNLASDAINQMVGTLADRLSGTAATQQSAPGAAPTTAPAEGAAPSAPAAPATPATPAAPTTPAAPMETPAASPTTAPTMPP